MQEDDILKVSEAGAVRLIQEMNFAQSKLSFRSNPKILRQELQSLIDVLKMILEDHNGYTIRLVQDKRAPWGVYEFATEEGATSIYPSTEPEMLAPRELPSVQQPTFEELLRQLTQQFPATPEYDYRMEIDHTIEVLTSMSAHDAKEAMQLIFVNVACTMRRRAQVEEEI